MNEATFRAWFEGYAENIGDRPTADQWSRVKERVAELSKPPVLIPQIGYPQRVGSPLLAQLQGANLHNGNCGVN